LVRRYSDLAKDNNGASKPSRGLRLGAFIDANLPDKLRAKDIANALGMSETCLKKAALGQFGMPLHQYVLERRLDEAENLIRNGMGIAQAALDCGFSSQSHLTSTMSARRGVTPALLATTDSEKL
jgi:AraC family transcriptional regulator